MWYPGWQSWAGVPGPRPWACGAACARLGSFCGGTSFDINIFLLSTRPTFQTMPLASRLPHSSSAILPQPAPRRHPHRCCAPGRGAVSQEGHLARWCHGDARAGAQGHLEATSPWIRGGSYCLAPALALQGVAMSPWEFLHPIPRVLRSVVPGAGATHVVHPGTVPRELPCGGRGCAAQLTAGGWDWGQFGQRVPGRTDVGLLVPHPVTALPSVFPQELEMPPPEAALPPGPPPAHLHVPLELSPRSSPAAKIKYSICIAGKSCKSLLSLSSCSRNIGGVICVGARPAALCSSPVWTTLPFPHVSPGDAAGAGGRAGPR